MTVLQADRMPHLVRHDCLEIILRGTNRGRFAADIPIPSGYQSDVAMRSRAPQDTDGDGTPNYLDADDDGDGIRTLDEAAQPRPWLSTLAVIGFLYLSGFSLLFIVLKFA